MSLPVDPDTSPAPGREPALVLGGSVRLGDELLSQRDYHVTPAGTGHRITQTDTGVVIYAHGDLDLKFVA